MKHEPNLDTAIWPQIGECIIHLFSCVVRETYTFSINSVSAFTSAPTALSSNLMVAPILYSLSLLFLTTSRIPFCVPSSFLWENSRSTASNGSFDVSGKKK